MLRRTPLKSAKTKKCKAPGCGKSFKPDKTTQKVCGLQCALALTRVEQAKAEEKKAREEAKLLRKQRKEFNRRDKKWQEKLTQAAFNRMRVLEEKLWFQEQGRPPECISCGKTNMDWCCGHFKTRGGFPELRYDPFNTWLQCNWNCNKNLSGNIHGNKTSRGYIQGLKDRFGEEEGQRIIDHCESPHPPAKLTWQDLEVMRKGFNTRIRELQSLLGEN